MGLRTLENDMYIEKQSVTHELYYATRRRKKIHLNKNSDSVDDIE